MKRHSTGNAFDTSIHGDELEHHRIQLEHNLQNKELSFRLSDDDSDRYIHRRPKHTHRDESSVEYPRHLSEPSGPEFPLFVRRSTSREQFGDEDQSQLHAWSYRSGDHDEGISPYGGDTVSTAAHHASALTLSAGLGGGRAARQRDPSMSGAEYDPDRPLHAIIAGVNSKHSMFDPDPSKHQTIGMTYDPLVVDSTAELDRILQSGHAPPPSTARPPSPTSSVTSGSDSSTKRRPKLTDHLRQVSFSPQRPRSIQSQHPANPVSPLAHSTSQVQPKKNENSPTPRPVRRSNVFQSYASEPATAQPEVRLHPATPSSTGSKFTRMARGINKDLEATRQQPSNPTSTRQTITARPASTPVEQNPFHDTSRQTARPSVSARNPTPRRSALRDTTKSRIHLPDVTGLTNAVESPMKHGAQYYPYKADERPRESEARLLQTLSAVQGQLCDLEEENGISRRRVRELEMELEECKRQVARERTRLFEREEMSIRGLGDISYRSRGGGGRSKAKAKARETAAGAREEIEDVRLHERYKEAVEEKKALEALITSLRSHLTRLTSELASHQALLSELRRLRDSDAQALREKGAEILQLKKEVQRLAGEVEVLRGVVEEGLKERRSAREIHIDNSAANLAMSHDFEEDDSNEEDNQDELEEEEEEFVPNNDEVEREQDRGQSVDEHEHQDEEDADEEPSPFDSNPARLRPTDRTMRTDFATLGSSTNSAPRRLVNDDDLDRIAAEVEERRSNLSNASSVGSGPGSQRARSRSRSPVRSTHLSRRATAEDVPDEEVEENRHQYRPAASTSQAIKSHSSQTQTQTYALPPPRVFTPSHPEPSTSRPTAPRPGRATTVHERWRTGRTPEPEPETPFPQIRGEQLERLFFSAPEHNAKTCTVCYRRRNRPSGASPSWSHPTQGPKHPTGTSNNAMRDENEDVEEDEGYQGSEGADMDRVVGDGTNGKGKERERESERERERQFVVSFSKDPAHWRQAGRKHGLPPQTVVARVIRELEDDFTHYKSVYVELADQYKVMDAVSDVPRRNLLARHLREVVDILEQKGDQIASLYDLLRFKDRENSESVILDKALHPKCSDVPTTSNPLGRHTPTHRRFS